MQITESGVYKDAVDKKGKIIWHDIHEMVTQDNIKNTSAWNLTKLIVNISNGGYKGIVSVDIKQDAISSVYANVKNGKTGEIFIVNRNGYIVSSLKKENLYTSIRDEYYFKWILNNDTGKIFKVNGRSVLITSMPLNNLNWYIVSAVPIKELTEENSKITLTIILLGFILIILTIIISFILARNITKPISRLVTFTKRVSEGNLDMEINIDRDDEISKLAEHFNMMIKSIKELLLKNYMVQKKKREYELSLLRSQVNPHFLYNTIENIRSLTFKGDSQGAFKVATNLGNFYKGVLSKGRDVITIEEEVNLTVNYLKIQKIRHEDLFDYKLDIDENILKNSILKLTIQPVVENSINHGFRGYRPR